MSVKKATNRSPRCRIPPALPLVLAAILAAAGCGDDGTTPDYRVDLVDEWGGSFRPEPPALQETSEIGVEITGLRGARVEGAATVNGQPYTVTGNYRPPVIFLELRSPEWATLLFVGEITSLNLMDGTLAVDNGEPLTAPLLLFRR